MKLHLQGLDTRGKMIVEESENIKKKNVCYMEYINKKIYYEYLKLAFTGKTML